MTEHCCADKLVLIRARVHPFPSRTRKLSSLLLTILGWRRPGKIGSANTKNHDICRGSLLFFDEVPPVGMLLAGAFLVWGRSAFWIFNEVSNIYFFTVHIWV